MVSTLPRCIVPDGPEMLTALAPFSLQVEFQPSVEQRSCTLAVSVRSRISTSSTIVVNVLYIYGPARCNVLYMKCTGRNDQRSCQLRSRRPSRPSGGFRRSCTLVIEPKQRHSLTFRDGRTRSSISKSSLAQTCKWRYRVRYDDSLGRCQS